MENGRYGIHGGQYIPETLMNEILRLEKAYEFYKNDPDFISELNTLLKEYAGRPSLLYYAEKMTRDLGGAKVYLKREDLNHTGSHKINNVLGQVLLAKRMGKTRVIAETGAGQHGVATATAAALTAQAFAHSLQAGQTVAQKGQFGLQLALVGDGAAAENFKDQHGAVDHFQSAQRIGDVADLAAGQFTVKYGAFRAQRFGGKGCFLQLAAAQHDAGLRGLALLGHLCHGFHVVCFAQGGKLCKAALAVPQALIQRQQNDLRRGCFYQNIVKFAQSKSFLLYRSLVSR